MKKIKIGETEFNIQPLNLGQLQEVLALFAETPDLGRREAIENRFKIVSTALMEDNPDMTVATIKKIRAPMEDINNAVTVIAELSGLVKPGEDQAETSNP